MSIDGSHYKEQGLQPWDAFHSWLNPEQRIGYYLGTTIAYLARFNMNESGKGGIKDLIKAKNTLDRLIQEIDQHIKIIKAAEDGWIDWTGSVPYPELPFEKLEIKFRNGNTAVLHRSFYKSFNWKHIGGEADVVQIRPIT